MSAPPPSWPLGRLALGLVVLVDLALAVALVGPRSGGRTVFVDAALPAPTWAAPEPLVGVDPAVLARLTADDVARGVWALAAGPDGPPLSPEQRATLAPSFDRARTHRDRVSALRTERRAAALAHARAATPLAATPAVVAAARRAPAPRPTGTPPRRDRSAP